VASSPALLDKLSLQPQFELTQKYLVLLPPHTRATAVKFHAAENSALLLIVTKPQLIFFVLQPWLQIPEQSACFSSSSSTSFKMPFPCSVFRSVSGTSADTHQASHTVYIYDIT
jgi:hypothetical protein